MEKKPVVFMVAVNHLLKSVAFFSLGIASVGRLDRRKRCLYTTASATSTLYAPLGLKYPIASACPASSNLRHVGVLRPLLRDRIVSATTLLARRLGKEAPQLLVQG